MKKKLFSPLLSILPDVGLCLFAYGLLRYGREASESLRQGLSLCAQVLIPSLFPFFVFSGLMVRTGVAAKCGRLLEKPVKVLFRLPGVCAPVFALGLLGGYPVGAKTACALYEQKLCSREETQRLLAFCNNCGPAFILGVAGLAVFHSLQAGLVLWGCHVAASLCTGLIFRFYGSSSPRRLSPLSSEKSMPFSHALVESVTSSMSSLLNVCAFVLFFGLCIGLLEQMGITGFLLSLLERLGVSQDFAAPVLSGCLEMTTGIWGLSETTGALPLRLSAAAFLLAFGGLSVHFQSLSFLTSSGLSAVPYFLGKMTHGVLSALFTYFIALRLPAQTAAAGGLLFQTGPASLSPLSIFLFSSLLCLILWFLTRLGKGKWGKTIVTPLISRYNRKKTG